MGGIPGFGSQFNRTPLVNAVLLLNELIESDSVSSTSNLAIAALVAELLQARGFTCEWTQYDDDRGIVKANLVARRGPNTDGGLAYFCHTDVVPAEDWTGPGGDPFAPVCLQDRIYGRGSCDMKGSLVAMLVAAEQFAKHSLSKPLWFVCTADEEVGFQGAKHLVKHSVELANLIHAQPVGIIGEPTLLKVVHAHKGITSFRIISHGRPAHSSTTRGVNANIAMVPMLALIAEIESLTRHDTKYHDNRFDPPTLSWNFGVSDRATALNITPARSEAWVSLRTMPQIDGEDLIERVRIAAETSGLEFHREEGGGPLWVDSESTCIQQMCELCECDCPSTVCYSTDGGQLTALKQLMVCGPGDIEQAHTADEWITLEQLDRGIETYARAIQRFCG